MKLPNGKTRWCKLHDVLYVPDLSHNLLSVSKATERGSCRIFGTTNRLIAVASKIGNLYHLNFKIRGDKSETISDTLAFGIEGLDTLEVQTLESKS